jgi:hypothetical protein
MKNIQSGEIALFEIRGIYGRSLLLGMDKDSEIVSLSLARFGHDGVEWDGMETK